MTVIETDLATYYSKSQKWNCQFAVLNAQLGYHNILLYGAAVKTRLYLRGI